MLIEFPFYANLFSSIFFPFGDCKSLIGRLLFIFSPIYMGLNSVEEGTLL